MDFFHQPSDSTRLGDYLIENLRLGSKWTHFRAAIAFIKRSGTRHLAPALASFATGSHAEIIAGIDHGGTSAEGLRDLLDAVSPRGRVIVFHNAGPHTFHPKIFIFRSLHAADVLIGSGNLTEGGLFTNYEAALRLRLNLAEPNHAAILDTIESVLGAWADVSTGTARVLTTSLLSQLTALGLTPSEDSTLLQQPPQPDESSGPQPGAAEFPFVALPEIRAPRVKPPISPPPASGKFSQPPAHVTPATSRPDVFVMTLQQTDVGFGQTTPGASQRSPEIFIPLVARDANPDFWGWPKAFVADPHPPGKRDRSGVRIRLAGKVETVNMMTWPAKHDFRLRCAALRSAGSIGDILRMERTDPSAGYDYYVDVIPTGTSHHFMHLTLCRHSVRNSRKKYGYY